MEVSVYVIIFQNKTLVEALTLVIQQDKVLSVIKIITGRSKNKLETLKTAIFTLFYIKQSKKKKKKEEVLRGNIESRKHPKQKIRF